MITCVGMPDLHAGSRFPVGASFLVKDCIYPALIGGDIGCGMTMYQLSVKSKKIIGKEATIGAKLLALEDPYPDIKNWMEEHGIPSSEFNSSLGTVGRGNHFAEIQIIDQIWDENIAQQNHLQLDSTYLLIHSGSRGLGKSILEKCNQERLSGPELINYLKLHDQACTWATSNRKLIAKRISDCLNIEIGEKLLDIWHNNVELHDENHFLHRKGSAPTDKGLIAIPGSRGTLTYIVQGVGNQTDNLWSVAHGAGRELSRNKALTKFSRVDNSKLEKNQFGGVVVCEDSDLLREEAPDAYKNIDIVVQDLVDRGIVKVIATMKPMVTYKMRKTRYD
jgi:release factor H-coupled RctB family protein